MTQNKRPFLIGEAGRLAAMGIGQLGCLLDVLDQIGPGGGEAFIGLRFRTTLDKSFHDTGSRDFLAATVEDFLLQLGNQGISLVAQLDGELRHNAGRQLSHL